MLQLPQKSAPTPPSTSGSFPKRSPPIPKTRPKMRTTSLKANLCRYLTISTSVIMSCHNQPCNNSMYSSDFVFETYLHPSPVTFSMYCIPLYLVLPCSNIISSYLCFPFFPLEKSHESGIGALRRYDCPYHYSGMQYKKNSLRLCHAQCANSLSTLSHCCLWGSSHHMEI